MKTLFLITAAFLVGLLIGAVGIASAAEQPSAMGGGDPVLKQNPNGTLEGTDGGGLLNQSTQGQATAHKNGD